jgi:cbb3-type cytochrome oxidase subunit 1
VNRAPNVRRRDLRAPMAVNPKKLRPYDEPPKGRRSLVPNAPDSAARSLLVLSVLWLLVATGIGMYWVGMNLLPGRLEFTLTPELPIIGVLNIAITPATVEAAFLSSIVYGWLSNAAFAAILFITPRITGAYADNRMGAGAAALWNIGVASGVAAVYLPDISGTGPLTSFPWMVDGLLLLGLLTVFGAFARTIMGAPRQVPYVSLLFFGVGLLAVMGSLALVAGASVLSLDETVKALVNAFAARAIGTYWVLGAALGALFYVVPRAAENPLASSGMAYLSWLLWAAFAGLSAIGSLVDPSIPFVITSLGQTGTMLLAAPIFLAVATLALTFSGRWRVLLSTGAAAYAAISMAFLLGASLLESIGALGSVQGLVRGTEWPTGVWIFGTLGGATFAMFAANDHAAPRLFRRDWGGSWAGNFQLWATYTGVVVAAVALIACGIAHGSLIMQAATAEEIRATTKWFWLAATGGLGLVAVGGLAAAVSLFLMYTTARRSEYAAPQDAPVAGGTAAEASAAH